MSDHAPPSPLEARLQALAVALERHVAEAEAELPAMPPAQAERCRQAVLAVAHHAATLARVVARHLPARDPAP